MEDSQVTGAMLEEGTTTNEPQVETSSPATETVENNEPMSVREAVLKAFEATSGEAKPTEADKPAKPELDAEKPAAAEPEKEVDPITGRELEPIKAPNSMTPALREKWNSVPRQMQQFWIDRERDMSQKLQETAQERKLAAEFRDVAAPYEAMLRQTNTTAVAHAKELFNVSHTLHTGTPEQRAYLFHQLMTHFRPDFSVMQRLSQGQPTLPIQAAPKPVDVQEEVNKALAQRAEQENQARIQRELHEFQNDPKNEFFADVRGLMGRILDAGLVPEGEPAQMFKAAYTLACQQDPGVRSVLEERAKAAETARAAQANGATTTKPVGSVKSSLGTGNRTGAAQKTMSVREALEAAWKDQTN